MSSSTFLHQLLDNPVWNLEEIEQFLTRDSTAVNAGTRYHSTPLKIVLEDGRCSVGMVRLLLRFGAKVNVLNDNFPPLLVAIVQSRDASIIRVLLEAGADVNHCGGYKVHALCEALYRGSSIDVIRLLLEVVDVSTYECGYHGSVMHCAMNLPRPASKNDVVKLLIEAGAKVDDIVVLGQSPMCVALQRSPVARDIEDLLRAGFSLSACRSHESPFFCATQQYCGNTLKACVVELLLKTGASIDGVDENGYTPLQRATRNISAKTEAIRLLFDLQNVDPNSAGDTWVSSLLTLAIQNDRQNLSVVNFLIKQGAQVKNVKQSENTALHLAAKSGNASVLEFLLKHFSLFVNSVNGDGKTPLRVAVEGSRSIDILHLLLAAGAQVGDDKADSLLEASLNPYQYCMDLDYFKILARYSLLQNPDFDIQRLIRGKKYCETLPLFVEGCKLELQEMESKDVGQGRSLLEFLSVHFLPQMDAAQFDPVNYGDFNRLLEVVEDNAFPIYFNVISTKVRRSSMKAKLEKVLVYTVKHCPDSTCMQKKVILDYDSVCKIAEYLSDVELLRLVFAFYNAGENAELKFKRSENVSKQNLYSKRNHKQSAKFLKRPKLF